MTRICGWCRASIDVTARRDARYCSKSCRQAAHRARCRLELEATADQPLRLAYADPPYPGKAHLYRGHADYAGEVDHAELIRRLSTYDGWALSTSAEALPEVLRDVSRLEPRRVRVAAWAKGRRRPHATARVLSAWEPVIWIPARRVATAAHRQVEDALIGVASRRRTTLPSAVVGMKPPAFSYWMFELLGADPRDTFDDLFPGSGLVGWCWQSFVDAAGPGGRDASHPPATDLSRPSTNRRETSRDAAADPSFVATAIG